MKAYEIDIIQEFEMFDLGNFSYFPEMKFVKTIKCIFLHQKKYNEEVL